MKAIYRLKQYIDNKGFNNSLFEKKNNLSNGYIATQIKRNADLGEGVLNKVLDNCLDINPEWLLTGNGEMLKTAQTYTESPKNVIPLYDDIATMGGTRSIADTQEVPEGTEYIDAGDWFKDVTAAIRHYGSSMQEYPNGCILALRKITDIRGIVWGRNYVIETTDIRVTKRMQTCTDDDNCIMAYSTNTETYPDGRLVHEPFKIYKSDIRHIFLVIGRVVKEYSSDPVYTLNK